MKMNLVTQSQQVFNQIQLQQAQAQTQTQKQSLLRLGSKSNRNFLPLLISGNKSCHTCGGK
jgi:hypothetical protein